MQIAVLIVALVAVTACRNTTPVATNGPVEPPQPPDSWSLVFSDGTNFLAVDWSDSLSRFVAVGVDGTILHSNDGSSWTPASSGTSSVLLDVIWADSEFIAVGWEGTVLRSPDGITWAVASSNVDVAERLISVAWNGSQFVATSEGSTDGRIYYSADAESWSLATTAPEAVTFLTNVVWSESTGQFVVLGNEGTVLRSPDGVTWESSASGASERLHALTWSESRGLFVAVAANGGILRSADGLEWQEVSSGTSSWLRGVTSNESYIVAVGTGGVIMYSDDDGITWSAAASTGTSDWLVAAAWSGSLSRFVAAGDGGIVASS
jgi:hypothetical protein